MGKIQNALNFGPIIGRFVRLSSRGEPHIIQPMSCKSHSQEEIIIMTAMGTGYHQALNFEDFGVNRTGRHLDAVIQAIEETVHSTRQHFFNILVIAFSYGKFRAKTCDKK